ncbi:MAG: hypothetical protein LBQ98_07405 [Nitrososphaerota archaeon]|nr:hypothetical protein [Nitrososphaerota archaeon]
MYNVNHSIHAYRAENQRKNLHNRRAQVYVPSERSGLKTLETCGFADISKTTKRGRL